MVFNLAVPWAVPDSYELRYRLVRTVLGGFFAYIIYLFSMPLGNNPTESYWLVLSALLIPQMRIGKTFWQQLFATFCLGLVIAVGVYLASCFAETLWVLACILFITTGLSVYIGFFAKDNIFTALFVNFFILLAAGLPTTSNGSFHRVEFILFGLLLTLFLQMTVWPWRLKQAISTTLATYVQALSRLQQTLFAVLLRRDYSDRPFFYEKELHHEQQQALRALHQCRALLMTALLGHKIFYYTFVKRLEALYEIIISIGLMRYRLTDAATFTVGEEELKTIAAVLTTAFNDVLNVILTDRKPSEMEALTAAILSYEKIYLAVVQVVAKDPMLFLFFIRDLCALREGMFLLCMDISKLKNRK